MGVPIHIFDSISIVSSVKPFPSPRPVLTPSEATPSRECTASILTTISRVVRRSRRDSDLQLALYQAGCLLVI